MKAVLALTTLPDARSAEKLARQIIEQGLAACVSIQKNMISVFQWKGKLKRSSEALLFIKTTASSYNKLEKYICSVHPYETPELILIPITQGYKPYLQWISKNTR